MSILKEFSFLLKLVFILLGCECDYYPNIKVMDFILMVTTNIMILKCCIHLVAFI